MPAEDPDGPGGNGFHGSHRLGEGILAARFPGCQVGRHGAVEALLQTVGRARLASRTTFGRTRRDPVPQPAGLPQQDMTPLHLG